jgi:hypothetical protein
MATGGYDGKVHFYKIDVEGKNLSKKFHLKVNGVINAIEIDSENRLIAVVTSGENRLGRWVTTKDKSSIQIFNF